MDIPVFNEPAAIAVPEHPLAPYAGMFKDNILFEAWQGAIEENRRQDERAESLVEGTKETKETEIMSNLTLEQRVAVLEQKVEAMDLQQSNGSQARNDSRRQR